MRLSASEDDKRLVALDRLMKPEHLARSLACLTPQLARQAEKLPSPFSAYRSWRSDGLIHHFPGNEFSYGRVFVSAKALPYLDQRSTALRPGAAVVKEAFRFASDGSVHLHEIAATRRRSDQQDAGWDWLKIDAEMRISSPVAECRSCHDRQAKSGHLFGYTFILNKR